MFAFLMVLLGLNAIFGIVGVVVTLDAGYSEDGAPLNELRYWCIERNISFVLFKLLSIILLISILLLGVVSVYVLFMMEERERYNRTLSKKKE